MPIVSHEYQRQINGYYCGPAATRVALTAIGQYPSQDEIASELHTTVNGTNSVNDVTRCLAGRGEQYDSTFISGSDATPEEANALWMAVQRTVAAGRAIVANVVGSVTTSDGWTYSYPGGHYVAVPGHDDAGNVCVADVDKREYWITVGQLATWIAGRGYAAFAGVVPGGQPSDSEATPSPYDNTRSPIFGVDLSDFDSDRGNSPATVGNYRASGISFVSHKTVEVTPTETYRHSRCGEMLQAAKDSGIPFIGGYVVPRSGVDANRIADEHLTFLDANAPWWREFPGFFHQVDLERWPYDSVPSDVGNALYSILRARTNQPVLMYASAGQYGSDALEGLLWNANYAANYTTGGFAELYDLCGGNSGPGWAPYGIPTREPAVWQYSSSAVVAGQHTTDVNAFRGSERDFAGLLGIKSPSTEEEITEDMFRLIDPEGGQFIVSYDPLSETGFSYVEITEEVDPKAWILVEGGVKTADPRVSGVNLGPTGANVWRPGVFGPSASDVRQKLIEDISKKVLEGLTSDVSVTTSVDYDKIEGIIDSQLDKLTLKHTE